MGYVFAALALAIFALDVWRGPMTGNELAFASTAEYWDALHRTSLIGLNSYIEKNLSTEVWDYAVLPFITWPAFVPPVLIALFFFIIAPRRKKSGRAGLMFPRDRR